MQPEASWAELRKWVRVKTDETVTVMFPNQRTRVPCRMVDRSEGGVQLRISGSARLPNEFYLLIGPDETRHVCRIAWRIGSRAGCQFIDQFSNWGKGDKGPCLVEADSAKGVIKSRLLKRPLIIS